MSPKPADDHAFEDPPEALIRRARAASAVGLALGDVPRAIVPRAIVRLDLELRRNHGRDDGDYYTARLATDPDLAEEIGRYLLDAAKAARADLARYLKTGDPR